VLEAPRESHRKMGYLSDFFGLYDALTVRQVLHYAAAAQGVPESSIAGLVMRTAEQLGIADKLAVKSAALSRGQRQRVAIGQAMVHQPQVLILDEPASGLDPEARHDLAQLFLALQASGMTLLVSSHILAELDEYSSHMLVMRAGRIIENRSLAVAAGQRVRIRIAFDTRPDLPAINSIFDSLSVIENHPGDVLVEVADSPGAASALLRQLMDAGLPISSFAAERQNLAASYLRTVQSPHTGAQA
jgi:ABC-2 type transport system ATP-binding protein